MKKLTKILLGLLVAATLLPLAASAAPYTTYTYTSDGTILSSPDAYVPDRVVDVDYMGIEDYVGSHRNITFDIEADYDFRDVFVGPDHKVYVVDGNHGALLILDRYYRVEKILNKFVNEYGVPDTFSGPTGVFVNDERIYVCDTDNNRIVMFDTDANYIKIIEKPQSTIFEEGSIYKPVAVAVDDFGRLFVISSTTYQGVIVMDENSVFSGFIGAQKDTVNLWQAIMRRFQTEEQREQSAERTSKELNNIAIDKDGFLYVTTSSIDPGMQQSSITSKSKESDYAPVKKLNSSGEDIMKRNGYYPPSGEVSVATSTTAEIKGASVIVDAAVGPEGTWSIIDQKRSKVFTYDDNGNLLFAFGDLGDQVGNVAKATGIVYQDSKILLLDKQNDSFVVYRRTEYGDLLLNALKNDNDRKYNEAINDWTEILKRNNNYELAYVQIGKALYRDGKYEESMEYFESIKETENWSLSFAEIRKDWANKYFWIIPIIIVAVFILVVKFFAYARKVNARAALKVGRKSLREELIYAFHVIFHPFDGFWDLKHERRGSVRSATIILLITVLAFFYRSVGYGYVAAPKDADALSILGTVAAVIMPLALFAIANWCFTTLFEGEGSLKDIYVACCYSLTPLPVFIILETILSNFIVSTETGIVQLLYTVAMLWMGLLLFFGMMITHDYTIFKNIITIIATIIGMMFLMFVGLLFVALIGRMWSFIRNIVVELAFRS
ncbi:MAG: YIP1 family protein [Clostridia bacterium]|nr:YIP1 family protein [Clostridia bacterium]